MSTPEELTAWMSELIPIVGAMGIQVVSAERGRVETLLPAGPNQNHFGAAYAGSLFTVAELLGGLITQSSLQLEGFIPLVKSLEIKFARPAIGDVTAVATLSEEQIATVLETAPEAGKADFTLEATIVDGGGATVASTSGLYQLRRLG